jgi:thiosulfate dehydrogenase (quinone) large subunit
MISKEFIAVRFAGASVMATSANIVAPLDLAQRSAAPMPVTLVSGECRSTPTRNARNVMIKNNPDSGVERFLIVLFRVTIGWTFLWAFIHHFGDDGFVTGFLSHTKTFHDVYAPFTNPAVAPTLTVLVEYGHLLIGLSLISGLLVRASAPFAIMLMLLYWTAHMEFPYVENANNYLVDYHIVYAGVLVYLIIKRAGHVLGLDGWVEKHLLSEGSNPGLRWLVA